MICIYDLQINLNIHRNIDLTTDPEKVALNLLVNTDIHYNEWSS